MAKPDIKEQAKRLRAAREAAGFEQAAEAITRFGWVASTYHAHENGQNGIKPEVAIKYARAFGVDAGWLLTGLGAPAQGEASVATPLRRQSDEGSGRAPVSRGYGRAIAIDGPGIVAVGEQEFTAIGRYDMAFSAGPGSLLEPRPEPLGFHLVETQWLRALTRSPADELAIVRVDGDSMEPTLCDSDWVLVDKRQTRISREGIYALHIYEDAWVKRLTLNLRDKVVKIISDNPRYPTQDMPEEGLHLIGRVIWIVARKVP